uniref:Uncharacterized protein n=1 Tax=Mesocestoides corti TaxID=53468 RepID=A0A5K3FNP1_MESCO
MRSLRLRHRVPPCRSMAPGTRILKSSFIRTDIYLGLSSRLGLGVSSFMTHTSEA